MFDDYDQVASDVYIDGPKPRKPFVLRPDPHDDRGGDDE